MVGIFDSGVGGLSVFREIKKILPNERYIYYSDNAHCPYGEKSKEYIIDRARQITDFLGQQLKGGKYLQNGTRQLFGWLFLIVMVVTWEIQLSKLIKMYTKMDAFQYM